MRALPPVVLHEVHIWRARRGTVLHEVDIWESRVDLEIRSGPRNPYLAEVPEAWPWWPSKGPLGAGCPIVKNSLCREESSLSPSYLDYVGM